ncbi:unnamed protein product [Alternaria alternata]
MDSSSLSSVFSEARPAVVIHTVGVFPLGTKRYSMRGKDAIFKINVEGTRNVVEASRECGAKAFVYTSSVTVVLDELDRDFRNVDERWPTGGVHTSYGQSKVTDFLFSYQTPFILGTGTNLQDFVYIENVADAHVLAVGNLLNSQTAAGEAMFITNGEPVTARALCLAVWKEFGHVPRFHHYKAKLGGRRKN